jgi:hypothetical protein
MDALSRSDAKRDALGQSDIEGPRNDGRLKGILVDLIASSKALDARVWLDGVYTEIADERVLGSWMNDRDVYFKVEGRIDKRNATQQ